MNLKKTAAVAAAALALFGGASLSIASAHADDAGSMGATSPVADPPAYGTKELLLKTNDSRVQGVRVFDGQAGTWSACIPTPDPNGYASTGLQVSAGTLSVDAFSKADCYEGELKDGMLLGGSMLSNGWIDTAPGFQNNTTGQVQVNLYRIIS